MAWLIWHHKNFLISIMQVKSIATNLNAIRTIRIFVLRDGNYEFRAMFTDPRTVALIKAAVDPERFDQEGDLIIENEFDYLQLDEKIKTGRKI